MKPYVILAMFLSCLPLQAGNTAVVRLADGFDFPVGKPEGEGYYKARGYRPNGHLGEDWNGKGGGDSDLGAPIYATANGLVLYAQNFFHGWGNVVIIRHAYEEGGEVRFVDSLYGHLDQIQTAVGQQVRRGQQIGTMGTGNGHYDAHLHFEIRKDLRVGMARSKFPRDDQTYWNPTPFIAARRHLQPTAETAVTPINTFVSYSGPELDDGDGTPGSTGRGFTIPPNSFSAPPLSKQMQPKKTPPKTPWKPDRFDDMREFLDRRMNP